MKPKQLAGSDRAQENDIGSRSLRPLLEWSNHLGLVIPEAEHPGSNTAVVKRN
jgi:hypothetical protein